MKTIYTTLPVYNRLAKQAYQRVKYANLDMMSPIITPLHRLPSLLWNVESDDPGEITDINLIDTDGVAIDIMTYFNQCNEMIQNVGGAGWATATYDAFTSVGKDITDCQKTVAAGIAYAQNLTAASSVPAVLNVGDRIRIAATFTWVSGTYPKIRVKNNGTGVSLSNVVTFVDGFQYIWLTIATGFVGTGYSIEIANGDTELARWSCVFDEGAITVMPRLITGYTDEYFQHNGETLGTMLPEGIYYLEMETEEGFVYYSDWLYATCVYENLITSFANGAVQPYETFTSTATEITSAIETGADGRAYSLPLFELDAGDSVTIIFFLTLNSGAVPTVGLYNNDTSSVYSQTADTVIGLNEHTFTAELAGNYRIRFRNTAVANWSASEVWAIRTFSEKYTRINFSNTCDLGEILYSEGLEQSLWLESEIMEPTFPLEEEGAKDGYARFIRSFARQDKKWLLRTKALPDFMADVLYRLMLHDTIELIDRVGDTHTVKALEVEHEYLWDDKYYAKFDLTFDFDEAVIIGGCCNNIT